jgi:hypothetical protein
VLTNTLSSLYSNKKKRSTLMQVLLVEVLVKKKAPTGFKTYWG